MSTLSDFFGGNNKIGINGSGKQVAYAMCSYNTGQGSGGFVFFDSEFRLVAANTYTSNMVNNTAATSVPTFNYMGSDSTQYMAQIFYNIQSTSSYPSSSSTGYWLNATNSSGEFGNSGVFLYSDGTYESAYGMSANQGNKQYLNAYAINSDHLNKRNGYILNNGAIRCIDKLSPTYNYSKVGTSDFTVSSLNTSMQGSASYNRVRKEMVILSYSASGGSFNVITYTNLDLDANESPATAFAAATRVDSTVSLSSSWSTNNNESYYNLKPILCNDGQVFVSVMFTSTAQRLYKFTRSGTSAATGTLLDSNTLTTSYGLDQGFQYGQRQITSRDGTTVAVFCPYYYYGSGIGCFMVNKATANYTKYSNTDSGYGTQVLPYRDNGWVFIYCGNGYAGNYTGNYIIGTWVPSTSVTANAAFTQMGSTKYFPAHTFPNTTNYPGFTQVVDYNALVPSSRGFK